MLMLESQRDEIIKGLLKISKDEKVNPETRRKIGYNLLSFGKINDVNTGGRTIVNQQQAIVSPYENMSEEDIERELAEIEELDRG